MTLLTRFIMNNLKRLGKLEKKDCFWYMIEELERLCQEEVVQKSADGEVYFLRTI